MSDGTDGGVDEGAPLEDLARSIEESDPPEEDAEAVWADIAAVGADSDRDTSDGSESDAGADRPEGDRLAARGLRSDRGTAGDCGRHPGVAAQAAISDATKIVHGYVTVLFLGSALLVFALAGVGAIPGGLWILGLPALALGIALSLPVLAWQVGAWDPTELA